MGFHPLRKAKLSKHTQISKSPDLIPNLIPEASIQDLTFQARDWESWSWGIWISLNGKSTNRGSCIEMVQTECPPESLRAVKPHPWGTGCQVSEEWKQTDMKIKQTAMKKYLEGTGDYAGRRNCKWKGHWQNSETEHERKWFLEIKNMKAKPKISEESVKENAEEICRSTDKNTERWHWERRYKEMRAFWVSASKWEGFQSEGME